MTENGILRQMLDSASGNKNPGKDEETKFEEPQKPLGPNV
jgi:hypothetical protein